MNARLLRVAQLLAAIAILGLLAWRLDMSSVFEAATDADATLLVAAILLNIPIAVLFGVRSQLVLTRLGHRLPFDIVLAAAIVGNVAGALTPASSGEILRAAALRSSADVSLQDGGTLVVYERALSLYLLVLGTAAAFTLYLAPPAVAALAIFAGILLLGLPVAASPLVRAVKPPTSTSASVWNRLRRFIADVATRISDLLDDWRLFVPWSSLTLILFATTTLQFWLIAQSLEGTISFGESWLAFGGSQLAALISLIPLGIGSSDASLAALLDRFGMTLESAAAAALIVRAVSTLPLLVAAALSWIYLTTRTPHRTRHTDTDGSEAAVERR